jgi:uncharacterized membrane protein
MEFQKKRYPVKIIKYGLFLFLVLLIARFVGFIDININIILSIPIIILTFFIIYMIIMFKSN